MQFRTKRKRARRPGTDFSVALSGNTETRTVVEYQGAPYVRHDRQVDVVVGGEVQGQARFKTGQRIFPAMYGHSLGFIGKTIDVKRSGDGSIWLVYLRVVYGEGQNGWYRQPDLTELDGVGIVSFKPGHSQKTNAMLTESHTQKLVAPVREQLPEQYKPVAEPLWQAKNYFGDRPRELSDPDWAFKLQCVCRLFGWLRQRGRALECAS